LKQADSKVSQINHKGEARNHTRTFQLFRVPTKASQVIQMPTPSHLTGQSDLLQVFEVDDTCTFCMDIPDLSGGGTRRREGVIEDNIFTAIDLVMIGEETLKMS